MHPVLFRLGPFIVWSYTALLDVGLIVGLVVAYTAARQRLPDTQAVIDAGFYTVLGGIVGARLDYVIGNWAYFATHWVEALSVWKGGLGFHGAFLGGLAALLVYTRYRSLPFWPIADALALGLAAGQVLGWVGCLLGGAAYGVTGVRPNWLAGYAMLPDIYGITNARFATQPVGALASLGLLAGLWAVSRRRWAFPGLVFLLYVLLNSGLQFGLGFVRGDETLYWGGWRVAQLVDLAQMAVAAVALLALWRRERD